MQSIFGFAQHCLMKSLIGEINNLFLVFLSKCSMKLLSEKSWYFYLVGGDNEENTCGWRSKSSSVYATKPRYGCC